MKCFYKIQVLILLFFFEANGQNRIESIIDSCKTVCDNRVSEQVKLLKLDYTLKYNPNQSFIRINFEDVNIKPRKILVGEINQIKSILMTNDYSFDYSFVYDCIYEGYSIFRVNLRCDKDNFVQSLASFNKLLIKIKKGKMIGLNKAKKIAIANNFNNTSFYELNEDPRWKGTNFYEEDEKKWKITWTLKEKNIFKNGKQSGLKVIKIDAKNGKVLSKYIEFEVD